MTNSDLCSPSIRERSNHSFKKVFFAIAAGAVFAVVSFSSTTKAATAPPVDVWWPAANATVSGVQPFKAILENVSVNGYYMFWQVGNGAYNFMPTNYQDYPHKEADVDLSGWNWEPSGNYTITFIAQNLQGQEVARTSVEIHIAGNGGASATTAPAGGATMAIAAPAEPSSVFSGAKLYVDQRSEAAQAASTLSSYDPYDASLIGIIAAQPAAVWFGGWNANVQSDVNAAVTAATDANALPVLVAYNIPNRDCGGYSAGGAQTAAAYAQWIDSFAAGINGRKAAVILEPDGTSATWCLSATDQQARWAMLSNAVNVLKAAGASVYIDAGHANWVDPSTMAANLEASGIANAAGFSLNISNFYSTSDNEAYGSQISSLTGGKHFVIDTGRNGNPSVAGQWCNPWGAALGTAPTSSTGNALVDAFLWIKPPGESDGTCNGGPAAGTFWDAYAEQLVKNAGL